jgi:hypothetical protein
MNAGAPLGWTAAKGVTVRLPSRAGTSSASSTVSIANPRRAESGVERLGHGLEPPGEPGRPGERQRPLPPGEVPGVEDHERQPAEVVAVEVADQHAVDRRGRHLGPLHRHQRGRPAVDHPAFPAGVEQEGCLEAPAAGEGVARAEEVEFDRHRPSLPGGCAAGGIRSPAGRR